MELKRAEILGKKSAKCFACAEKKEVLVCKEKSTGKTLMVCKDCINEAGEEEIFYSKNEKHFRIPSLKELHPFDISYLKDLDGRVRFFLLFSFLFLATSFISFFYRPIKMLLAQNLRLGYLYPYFKIVLGTENYLQIILLILPLILAFYVSFKVTKNKGIYFVGGSSLFVKGKPKELVDRTNNIIGTLIGIFILFFGLFFLFL